MSPWWRKRSGGPSGGPAAWVEYFAWGTRSKPPEWDEAWREVLRVLNDASAPKERLASMNEEVTRMFLQKEHFVFAPTRRSEKPEFFQEIRETYRTVSEGGGKAVLSDTDRGILDSADTMVGILYKGPPWPSHQHLEVLNRLAGATASLCNGIIQDFVTMRFYGRGYWESEILPEERPRVQRHAVIHIVPNADEAGMWAHTHGLCKFAQPELEVRGFPEVADNVACSFLNEVGQWLIDGGAVREGMMRPFGPARTEWQFARAENRDGHYPGQAFSLIAPGDNPRSPRRTTAALTAYAGISVPPDQVLGAQAGDPEMEAAHCHALDTLPAFRQRFFNAQTVPENKREDSYFYVKKSFEAPGGDEFMWLAVVSWTGNRLSGVLINEPDRVRTVRYGSRVTLKESDIYDWMISKRDESTEGAFTDEVLLRRSGGA